MKLKPQEERILALALESGSITIKAATRQIGLTHGYACRALGRLNAHQAIEPRGDRRDGCRVFILTAKGIELIRALSGHATLDDSASPTFERIQTA
jgi:DNA-binding MarR family transcriptional regulator